MSLKKEIKNILKEQLLLEVSFEDAAKILDSKIMLKVAKKIAYDARGTTNNSVVQNTLGSIKGLILQDAMPDDISDNQKGLSVLWLCRLFKKAEDPKSVAISLFGVSRYIRNTLEKFFHWQQFMSEKDLMKIVSLEELSAVVNKADSKIKQHQEKKSYNDAKEGTEVLRNDDEWFIAALHNKGAACHWGKGTEWCTAAPGLEYFKTYYGGPEDPLFYFENKKTKTRFQANYGKDEFEYENKTRPSDSELLEFTDLLLKTGKAKKFTAVEDWKQLNSLDMFIKEENYDEIAEIFARFGDQKKFVKAVYYVFYGEGTESAYNLSQDMVLFLFNQVKTTIAKDSDIDYLMVRFARCYHAMNTQKVPISFFVSHENYKIVKSIALDVGDYLVTESSSYKNRVRYPNDMKTRITFFNDFVSKQEINFLKIIQDFWESNLVSTMNNSGEYFSERLDQLISSKELKEQIKKELRVLLPTY